MTTKSLIAVEDRCVNLRELQLIEAKQYTEENPAFDYDSYTRPWSSYTNLRTLQLWR